MRKRHDQLAARLKSGGLEESHDQDNEGGQQDEGNIAGDEDCAEEDMDDGQVRRPAKRRRYNPRPPRGDDFFGIMTTWLAEQVRKYDKPIGKSDKWERRVLVYCFLFTADVLVVTSANSARRSGTSSRMTTLSSYRRTTSPLPIRRVQRIRPGQSKTRVKH